MIDIHCHILPGVDDGSGNTSDSVEMACLAYNSGIRGMIATPHCNIPGVYSNLWSSSMEEKLATLNTALARKNVAVTIYPGQEVYLASGFEELLRKGKLITLNRSRYLLVEFGFEETTTAAYRKIQMVTATGYTPIVAHPERYGFVIENREAIFRLKELRALLQVNKGSLQGYFGTRVMRTADWILRHYQADFVASDAHSQYKRTPYMADIFEMICTRYSDEYADLLLDTNPRKVINNAPIPFG